VAYKYTKCPKCGGPIETEKDSSSGRAMREYTCHACHWSDYDDEGTALWKAISDLKEKKED
jgi:transposase-like protein